MILTERFILLVAIGALLIGFSGWFAPMMLMGVALISLTIVLAVAELVRLTRGAKVEITRLCDDKLSLGADNPVILRLRNSSYRGFDAVVRDEYPDDFETSGNVIPLELGPRSEMDRSYAVRPPKRGDFKFGDIYLRLYGPLKLVVRQIKYAAPKHVKVYPNLLDMRRYEIGLKRQRAVQAGQRIVRILGRGTEFESLREYVPDDEMRSVDWKATAKRGKLISRQYQQERSQNVMLVLDCGRVMGPVVDGLTRLDHAVNAAMMLAHVAASKGDKVGLMAFGDDINCYSPPKAGKSQTLNLLSMTYNLKDAEGESNYHRAIPYLARKWTRRSLIVVFTDLIDPDSSKPLISQIASLTKKHLCICVSMADPVVIQAARGSMHEPEDAFRAAAARQVLEARKLAAAQLMRAGAIVLDITPEHFTPTIVDRYLDVKSRGRL